MTTRQKVDIEKLEEFRKFLDENPDKGKLRLEANAIYEGQAGRSTVHVGPYGIDETNVNRPTRHYTFPFGAWREVEEMTGVEGPTDRMEPVETALAAMAACLVNSVTFNAARLGIDTEGLEIRVSSEIDPRVLFQLKGLDDQKACLGTVRYDVRVTGDVSDEDMETIRELCAHSPVHGLFAEAIDIDGEVRRGDGADAED